ncbi:hypothetical protein S245_025665, partial [Arachis hypogaea]
HRGSSLSVGVPWVRYYGSYKDLDISLFWPGKDPALGKGANVGDIFIISDCAFHDKRIPIPISYDYRITYCCIAYILWKAALVLDFYLYGVGLRKVFETSNLVKELNLQ